MSTRDEHDAADAPLAKAVGDEAGQRAIVENHDVLALPTLEALARDQHARPVTDVQELRLDVWSSEQELQEFLVDWRASRDASPPSSSSSFASSMGIRTIA